MRLSVGRVPAAPPRRYPFDFSNAEKPYESYNGLNVRLRYFIRVTVTRGYPTGNLVKEQDFVVQRAARAPGPRAFFPFPPFSLGFDVALFVPGSRSRRPR